MEDGSLSLLQGIFPTEGSNPGLQHCRQILYQVREQDRRREMSWKAFGGEAQVQVVSLAGDDLLLGQPCRSISKRVKSVTIKNKTWGSLKGPRGPFRSLPVAVTQARMPLPSTLQGDFVKVTLKGVFRSLVLSAVMKVSAAMNYVEFEGSRIKGHKSAWIAKGDLLCSGCPTPLWQGPLGGTLQDGLLNKFFPLNLLICSDFCLAPAEVSLQGAHPAAAGMWLHLACLSPCCWSLLWDNNNTGSRP